MNGPAEPSRPLDSRADVPPPFQGGPASTPGAASAPPVIDERSRAQGGKPSSLRTILAAILSLFLGLCLVAGALSLLDDSLVLILRLHVLTGLSGMLSILCSLGMLLVYVLMGITPMVPKRVFLPLVAFMALSLLILLPVMIYRHQWMLHIDWALSLVQVLFASGIIYSLARSSKSGWRVVSVQQLGSRSFSFVHLCVFLAVNLFVLVPAVAAYLTLCASLAVDHFSAGFVSLRQRGLVLQSRTYVRQDGKTVLLFPMIHMAETDFYRAVSRSAPTNSIVLLEGVSDENNLLTNRLSYKKAANSLGLAEQREELDIPQAQPVRADVDVGDFSPSTIGILNMVALVYSEGPNARNIMPLLQLSPSPEVEQRLIADLLLKRNEHVVMELRNRLTQSDYFLIPWGAAHMPGIEQEILKDGFRLAKAQQYYSIRFGAKPQKLDPSPTR